MATAEARPELHNLAGRRPTLIEDVREIAAFAYLLKNLIQRDLTVRYKRSVLGFFWTMLNPLLLMLILLVVFAQLFRFQIPHYETYFLSAFLVWNYFAQSTVMAMTSLAWNGDLMKRVRVPKAIFAVSTTLSGLVNLFLSLIPLLIIMLIAGAPIRATVFFLPVSFAAMALFTLGISLGLSAVAVYFDDVAQMYQVGIMALMYLTPIMYPISIVPEKYLWLVKANPVFYLVELTRAPLWGGVLPSLEEVAISYAIALLTFALGWFVFRRLSSGFYLYL
ncbi:MAG: ABC transporter permease [Acidobacteriota bacterium]